MVWSPWKQTKQSNQTYNSLSLSLSLSLSWVPSFFSPFQLKTLCPHTTFILFRFVLLCIILSRLSLLLHWFCLSVRERDYWNALLPILVWSHILRNFQLVFFLIVKLLQLMWLFFYFFIFWILIFC
jgi:hypothetical protein